MSLVTNFTDWRYREVKASGPAEVACVVCSGQVAGECYYCPSLARLVHPSCFFHGGDGVCNRNSCGGKHLPITHYVFEREHVDFFVKRVVVVA